ncbi:MAG: pantetheine-phosphate adenylyltransferase [Planctomycetota bacterium]
MKAFYPGSFDPPHLGHLDVIRRAARIVDQLVVGVGSNPDKKPYLPAMSRVEILRAECATLRNVEIVQYSGATVSWARQNNINALIRGLRNANDIDGELGMAVVNRGNGVETMFLVCDPSLGHISSSLIRHVMAAGLNTDGLISSRTAEAIRRWSAP